MLPPPPSSATATATTHTPAAHITVCSTKEQWEATSFPRALVFPRDIFHFARLLLPLLPPRRKIRAAAACAYKTLAGR